MNTAKIAITMDRGLLERLDELVGEKVFRSRSRAIQEAVDEKLKRLDGTRLARECAKLDPRYEKILAEEGMSEEADAWPEY